jgi:flagellar hook-associated protein 1 FlgK
MSLTAGLTIARSALATIAGQTAIVSRNIAGASDPNYARRTADLIAIAGGGVGIDAITRSTDKMLFGSKLDASSRSVMQQAILASLDRLHNTVGDPELDTSPAALIGKLTDALQLYATSPQDATAAAGAVTSADSLARALVDATKEVQASRAQADGDMVASVDRINSLLSQLESVNNVIVGQSGSAADLSDYLDQRDAILSDLSEEIGIRTVPGENNGVVVYTDGGATLFETTARKVELAPTATFTAGTTGKAVYVDGMPVTGDSAGMPIHSGKLAGLAAVRDDLAPSYQGQLDEIARGLIMTFAESDQSDPPSLPDVPGLFTWSGAPSLPGSGVVTGLAGSIKINPTVDPSAGGDPTLLRDGSIFDPGNPAYTYNPSGAAGFTDRIQELIDKLSSPFDFDSAAGLGGSATIANYAASSSGWLEASRKTASDDSDYNTALLARATESLSNATGVNIDEEMTKMLDLERSYQASAKLISTIDTLLDALLSSV